MPNTITNNQPPLVLINGLGATEQDWGHFAHCLTANGNGHQEIVFAQLDGHCSIPTASQSIVRQLDAHNISVCDILGYSYGGAVAQQLAFDNPGRVRRMVLAATAWGVGSVPPPPLFWPAGTAALALMSITRPQSLAQAAALASWSSYPWLPQVHTPTLVMAGSADRLVPPINSRLLSERLPNADLLLINGASHNLLRTHLESCTAAIQRFFEEDSALIGS